MEIPESEELQEPRNKTASSGARESKGQDGRGQGSGGGGNRLRPFVRERRKAEDLMANSSPELGSVSRAELKCASGLNLNETRDRSMLY
ncbi:hypothetical protein NC652_011988 [Populus alba x Populus x berolinensis]|nr:hypothetical protein NC652_011988 [Populus alba x Populus x berolinensis]